MSRVAVGASGGRKSATFDPIFLLEVYDPGTLVIDMSSSLPTSARRLGAEAEAHGIVFVDAPVSGGVARAETAELIFITSLTVMRASKGHIQSHIRVAPDLGLSATEILEAIEITLPEAGVVAFQEGFNAWAEVVGADGIEPSPEVLERVTSVAVPSQDGAGGRSGS